MGQHSDWPYPTGDPIPSEDEMVEQAGQMLAQLSRGKSITTVAREFGMARDTVYARLKLISRRLPDRQSLRVINFERSEQLYEQLSQRLDDEISTADFIRATGELRAMLTQQVAWFKLDDTDEAPEQDDPEIDEWVAEVAGENEAEIREVRGA